MSLSWDNITEKELKKIFYRKKLSDGQIAEKYGVAAEKVTYKRNKIGISIEDREYEEFMDQQGELFEKLNLDSKKILLKKENIDEISKAITHFIFINGPIENMYSDEKISQNDMKKLNKFMVNRIAGLLTAIADNSWLKLELLLNYYRLYGSEWDKAEPDMEQLNFVFNFAVPKNLR